MNDERCSRRTKTKGKCRSDMLMDQVRWNESFTNLLVTTRLEMEDGFAGANKSVQSMWRKTHIRLIEKDTEFPFSMEECQKKYNNLMKAYQDIKKRGRKTGTVQTRWPYFQQFDAIYGNRRFVQRVTIDESPNEKLRENEDVSSKKSESVIDVLLNSTTSTTESEESEEPPHKKPKTRMEEVLSFFKAMRATNEFRQQEELRLKQLQLEVGKKELEVLKVIKNCASNYLLNHRE